MTPTIAFYLSYNAEEENGACYLIYELLSERGLLAWYDQGGGDESALARTRALSENEGDEEGMVQLDAVDDADIIRGRRRPGLEEKEDHEPGELDSREGLDERELFYLPDFHGSDPDVEDGPIGREDLDMYLEKSAVVLVFLSRNVFNSKVVQGDIAKALELGKPFALVHEPDSPYNAFDGGDSVNLVSLTSMLANRLQQRFLEAAEGVEIFQFYRSDASLAKGMLRALLENYEQYLSTIKRTTLLLEFGNAGADLGFDAFQVPLTKAKEFVPGTRKWAFQALESWYKRGNEQVFVLLGPAGVGKSTFLAEVCRRGGALPFEYSRSSKHLMNTPPGLVPVVAQHFFRMDRRPMDDPFRAVRSLALQLCDNLDGFQQLFENMALPANYAYAHPSSTGSSRGLGFSRNLPDMFTTLLASPLRNIERSAPEHIPKRPVAIVLDGLDECDPEYLDDLLSWIQRKWNQDTIPSWMKLIISSRPESYIPMKVEKFSPREINTDDIENNEDIRVYFESQLHGVIENRNDMRQAVDILMERSQGLFLYARFLKELVQEAVEAGAESGSRKLTMKMLQDESFFPIGLGGIYQTYFSRFQQRALNGDKKMYHRILSPLLAAREPLTIEIWMELCGYEPRQYGEFDEAVLKPVRSLIYIGGERNQVRFLHNSMKEFLTRRETPKDLRVSLQFGNLMLATWCKSNPMTTFSMQHLIYHLARTGNHDKIANLLLDFQWIRTVAATSSIDDLVKNAELYDGTDFEPICTINALRLSARATRGDWRELPGQLYGRLQKDHPLAHAALYDQGQGSGQGKFGLFPVLQTLTPATSSVRMLMLGHTQSVKAVAFSANMKMVASGSDDSTVKLWNAETGEIIYDMEGHEGEITSVAFSPDNLRLVSASFDYSARLWDVKTGEYLRILRLQKEISSVQFSPWHGSSLMAVGTWDLTILLWDPSAKPSIVDQLEGHSGNITAVAFPRNSDDERGISQETKNKLASACYDGEIFIWDLAARKVRFRLDGHSDCVTCIEFVPTDDEMLLSGSRDSTFRVWDLTTQSIINSIRVGDHVAVYSLAISPDGTSVAVATEEPVIRFYDLPQCDPVFDLEGHEDSVAAIALSANGERLVSGSADHSVRVWDTFVREQSLVAALDPRRKTLRVTRNEFPTSSTTSCDISTDGSLAVFATWSGEIRLYDTAEKKPKGLQFERMHELQITSIKFTRDARFIAGSVFDGSIIMWKRKTGELHFHVEAHDDSATVIALATEGASMIASAGLNGLIKLWTFDTTSSDVTLEDTLVAHSDVVSDMCFSAHNQYLASCSQDGSVVVWDVNEAAILHQFVDDRFEETIVFVAFKSINLLLTNTKSNLVSLWNVQSGQREKVIPTDQRPQELANVGSLMYYGTHVESSRRGGVGFTADGPVRAVRFSNNRERRFAAVVAYRYYLLEDY